MKEYEIEDGDCEIFKFVGEELCRAEDLNDGRKEAVIYKTKAGKFICQLEFSAPGAPGFKAVFVASNMTEVRGFFGHDTLARALYEKARIENITFIE